VEGIPTMGFYGQFSPLVQGYSCAESPFWMGKAFLCLHLPGNHPFWTETEKNGSWEKLEENGIKETVLNGPALCFTNHKANGETILRTGKIVKNVGDKHGLWNYAKLCFNTKYPWEATPQGVVVPVEEVVQGTGRTVPGRQTDTNAQTDLAAIGEVESQQYVLKDLTYNTVSLANATFWGGVKDGILYRRQYFDYRLNTETHWIQGLFLADFPVPYGIMRADKMKLFRRPVRFTLGAYGFPDNGTTVKEYREGGAKAVVLSGRDATGKPRQLAMTIYDGWDKMGIIYSTGTNPDSKNSIVVYAEAEKKKQYGGGESYVMISQVITKEDEKPFTKEEIFPIRSIFYTDKAGCGTFGPVRILLKNGEERVVDYEGMEGNLRL
ncbi:MAG: DUF2264 domain-containing protein, partial [Lachnospiraceae bacterium]|nr:DUF2264 domain-containing protein [Lachnospiraceae bacterium]